MFEAGRRSLKAFSANNTRPVSTEDTFTPMVACTNSGFLRTSEILACSSVSVFVVAKVFEVTAGATGDGDGDGCSDGDGDATGNVEGVGLGFCRGLVSCAAA
jgi:hypothetical protein